LNAQRHGLINDFAEAFLSPFTFGFARKLSILLRQTEGWVNL